MLLRPGSAPPTTFAPGSQLAKPGRRRIDRLFLRSTSCSQVPAMLFVLGIRASGGRPRESSQVRATRRASLTA